MNKEKESLLERFDQVRKELGNLHLELRTLGFIQEEDEVDIALSKVRVKLLSISQLLRQLSFLPRKKKTPQGSKVPPWGVSGGVDE
jgi:hypothetical protein